MIPPLSLMPVLPKEDLHPPSLQRDIGHLCGGPADLLVQTSCFVPKLGQRSDGVYRQLVDLLKT